MGDPDGLSATDEVITPFTGIQECIAHVVECDLSCEHCQSELTAKADKQRELAAEADTRIKNLVRDGVQIDPANMFLERLDTLIDSIVSDPRQRVHFEAAYNARVINRLIDVEKQVQRQKIVQGVPSAGGPITLPKRGGRL